MRKLARIVVAATAFMVAASTSVYADNDPSNNTCGGAETKSEGTSSGYAAYPSDYQDFYKFYATPNDEIRLTLDPSDVIGPEIHMVLHYPGCAGVAAFDYQPGPTTERITYTPPFSGNWVVEVWAQYQGNYYALTLDIASPGASQSCSASATVGAAGAPSCLVAFPICPTSSCTYKEEITISGTGNVSGSFDYASCSGVNSCSDTAYRSGSPGVALCATDTANVALFASITCKATITSV